MTTLDVDGALVRVNLSLTRKIRMIGEQVNLYRERTNSSSIGDKTVAFRRLQ